jgi:hypothetical protein
MRLRSLVLATILAWLPAAATMDATRGETKPPGKSPESQLPVTLEQTLYLIRSTLLTLNDANRSGNYTVLRDLASPGFQARNTAADLSLIFADLRKRNVDLFAVALIGPQLSTAPYIDPNKMLRITGFFPTRPLQINFDLLYQVVNGHWRLNGISVATPQAPPEPPPQQEPPKAKSSKGKR